MFTSVSGQPFGVGSIRLSDGAILRLKILIVDIKETDFSPFGGTSFNVNVTDSPRELVKDKPPFPSGPELPRDGWELLSIVE